MFLRLSGGGVVGFARKQVSECHSWHAMGWTARRAEKKKQRKKAPAMQCPALSAAAAGAPDYYYYTLVLWSLHLSPAAAPGQSAMPTQRSVCLRASRRVGGCWLLCGEKLMKPQQGRKRSRRTVQR